MLGCLCLRPARSTSFIRTAPGPPSPPRPDPEDRCKWSCTLRRAPTYHLLSGPHAPGRLILAGAVSAARLHGLGGIIREYRTAAAPDRDADLRVSRRATWHQPVR